MARLFVPAGFEAASVSPELYAWLRTSLPAETCVLLEFYSPGPKQRQVDLAVLGPYGVDIVEVKAKTGGAVVAHPNGPWQMVYDDGSTEPIPLNGAAGENPYDQVLNTARDFEGWLGHVLGGGTKVFPLVVVPHGRRDHNLRNRGFVWAAGGLESFRRSLRSARPFKGLSPDFTPEQQEGLISALGLGEMKEQEAPERPAPKAASSPAPANELVVSAHTPETVPATPSSALPHPSAGSRVRVLGAALLVVAFCAGAWLMGRSGGRVEATPRGSAALPVVARATTPDETTLPGTPFERAAPTESAADEASAGGAHCPVSHPVKGNVNDEGEQIFHLEGQAYYDATRPERCFSSAEAARAEGFRASMK